MRQKFENQTNISVFDKVKQLINDLLHIFDIYTDLALASRMYFYSREDIVNNDGIVTHDYNKCFIWISMCVFGPYIIQYSTQMSMLYQKGVFEANKMKRHSFLKRVCLNV